MSEDNDIVTIATLQWGKCPVCDSEHLLGLTPDGISVRQFGILAKQDESEQDPDDDTPQFMFTYFSQPTEDREEPVQFDLFSDDEEGIRVQAMLIAMNGMCKPIVVEKGTVFTIVSGPSDRDQSQSRH